MKSCQAHAAKLSIMDWSEMISDQSTLNRLRLWADFVPQIFWKVLTNLDKRSEIRGHKLNIYTGECFVTFHLKILRRYELQLS